MNATTYVTTVADFYASVAATPDAGPCCVGGGSVALPELVVPPEMEAMNYECGSSVQPSDLANSPRILCVGVGGGKEALQLGAGHRLERGIPLDVCDKTASNLVCFHRSSRRRRRGTTEEAEAASRDIHARS